MDYRNMPELEVVIRDGQPIWRVCGMGLCVEDGSGTRAAEVFDALCRSRGVELPRFGEYRPHRGPCEVDEPGV